MAQNYFEADYISQSDLKAKVGMVYSYTDPTGSLVDCILTESEDKFKETYLITRLIVSPAIRQLYNEIYSLGELTDDNILLANEEVNYGKGHYSLERIKKDLNKFKAYWEEKQEGKEIITIDEYQLAQRMAAIVSNHPSTQFLKQCITQREIYNEDFYGYRVKGKTDYELHQGEKRQVIDLKTIASYKMIRSHFWKYRYDLQLAWYNDIDPEEKETVLPKIVFISPYASYPVVVNISAHSLSIGRSGGYKTVDRVHALETGVTVNQQEYLYGYLDLLNYEHDNWRKPAIYPNCLPHEI